MQRVSLTVSQARKTAYHWLALQMGIDFVDCHIGEFDIEQCNEVMRICKPYIAKAMQQIQNARDQKSINPELNLR